jgi:hypothetical protein
MPCKGCLIRISNDKCLPMPDKSTIHGSIASPEGAMHVELLTPARGRRFRAPGAQPAPAVQLPG